MSMICLDKLQKVLADIMSRELESLPKVPDILKAQGYIGADKGGEIIYFDRATKETSESSQWLQNGNVISQSITLENGKKILLSKDRIGNIYAKSDIVENPKSYDELKLNQSLQNAQIQEIESKIAQKLEAKANAAQDLSRSKATDKLGIKKLDSQTIKEELDKQAKEQEAYNQMLQAQKAHKEQVLAQKEANLGKRADELELDKGENIPYKPIRETSIILSDEVAPFNAEFVVVKASDIKPSFEKGNTQGRMIKQESVIKNIIDEFNPALLFYQEGRADGLPIITRDGKVVAGNHRSEAINTILQEQTPNAQKAKLAYKQGAKDFLNIDLQEGEVVVRMLKENISDKDILALAFSSNIGRESTIAEKALSNLSLYNQNIATLPKYIDSDDVKELSAQVAKVLDKKGNGLNTFDTNLALLAHLSRNARNSDILKALDSIKGDMQEKLKITNMYVENAGSFHNLVNDTDLKSLDLRDYLSEAIYYTAKSDSTRELDYTRLINEIEGFKSLSKEGQEAALMLDNHKLENLTAQTLGLALAKFTRQENPSAALYECLKNAKKELIEQTQPTFFSEGKALSEVDIYDFLEFLITQGQSTRSSSRLRDLMPTLREMTQSKEALESSAKKEAKQADESFTDKDGKTHNMQEFANNLYTKAKEQESEFKGFLQSLSGKESTIIDSHITKSPDSIKSKIRRKDGDTSDIANLLRAAIIVDENKNLDKQLVDVIEAMEQRGIKADIELKHRESGYKGLHLQFEFNGIKSEIQLHTKKGWEIKKQQDKIYKVLREQEVNPTLSPEEVEALREKSKKLGNSHEFSIKDFASFEVISTTSSNSEKSVLRKKERVSYSTQEPFLNSKNPPSVDLPSESSAYNRFDSTLSVNDNLSTGSGNKESIQTPLNNSGDIIAQEAKQTAQERLDKIDLSPLNDEQKQILQVFKGEIPSTTIQGKDLQDLYTLEQGSRQKGARKILIKHYGVEKTGGLSDDELLSMSEVIKKGEIDSQSFELKDDFIRYAYDYDSGAAKLRIVIDEFNDGKKVFDFYSDRNFVEKGSYKPDLPTPTADSTATSQTSLFDSANTQAKKL